MAAESNTHRSLRIAGIQLASRDAADEGDVAANLAAAEAAIMAATPADLYVLPELTTVGYNPELLAKTVHSLAESIPGRSFRFFSDLAIRREAAICYGFPRARKDGGISICQAVVDKHGSLLIAYDKMHLCSFGVCSEKALFTPGTKPAVFSLCGVRIGLLICYDFRFPELARHLAWRRGVDVIVHASAFPRDGAHLSLHAFAATRALENGVYLLSVNRAGDFFGGSSAWPPWWNKEPELKPAVLGTKAAVLLMDVDSRLVERVRREIPFRVDLNDVLRSKL
eukprot:PLAT1501.1.p1 GENE.PLAT1501.1~~PLAT1501.1.p1  ORF type:complete len:282 (+),score=101.01 PLAT1501.1:44-889(+)